MTDLKWGQTPWDELPREELLKTVWRQHAALIACNSILKMASHGQEEHPYWGTEGVGGATREQVRQALALPDGGSGEEERAYDVFFRYAHDLLFEANGYELITDGWRVCPTCDSMLGRARGRQTEDDDACPMATCNGTLRPLQWSDLRQDIN